MAARMDLRTLGSKRGITACVCAMTNASCIHAGAEELNRVYYADLAINASMSAAAHSLEALQAPAEVP